MADSVLALHVAVVAFVVAGLPMIVIGNLLGWAWVNSPWFRLAHLATILLVIGEAWFGMICPLTTWEMALRAQAGAPTYGGSFIEHWLQRLLYYDAPAWVFQLGYSLFGLLVGGTWWCYPPRFGRRPNP